MIDLSKLEAVLNYADNHQVKNVVFNLDLRFRECNTPTKRSSLFTYLKRWSERQHNELNSPIRSKEPKPKLLGIAIRTRRRKCVVLVYFR